VAFTLSTSNANPSLAAVGDLLRVSIETSIAVFRPYVTVANEPAVVYGFMRVWTADLVVSHSSREGLVNVSAQLQGLAGSAPVTVSLASSIVIGELRGGRWPRSSVAVHTCSRASVGVCCGAWASAFSLLVRPLAAHLHGLPS
jgi:hypothetical protein